jgi:segregation and condensation protein B
LIYATTKKFLEVFDLKNLKDLPTPKEIEALESDTSDKDEVAHKTVTVVKAPPKLLPLNDSTDVAVTKVKESQPDRIADT